MMAGWSVSMGEKGEKKSEKGERGGKGESDAAYEDRRRVYVTWSTSLRIGVARPAEASRTIAKPRRFMVMVFCRVGGDVEVDRGSVRNWCLDELIEKADSKSTEVVGSLGWWQSNFSLTLREGASGFHVCCQSPVPCCFSSSFIPTLASSSRHCYWRFLILPPHAFLPDNSLPPSPTLALLSRSLLQQT